MDSTDLRGIIRQDARGPQGIAEIVAPALEFGGQAAIDGKRRAAEDVADGDQM
jgi:hypothetical protein